jgi:hypothetical protein
MDQIASTAISMAVAELFKRTKDPKPREEKLTDLANAAGYKSAEAYAVHVVSAAINSSFNWQRLGAYLDINDRNFLDRYAALNKQADQAANAIQSFFNVLGGYADTQTQVSSEHFAANAQILESRIEAEAKTIVESMGLRPQDHVDSWRRRLDMIRVAGTELKTIADTTCRMKKDLRDSMRTQGQGRALNISELVFAWVDLTGVLPGKTKKSDSPFGTFLLTIEGERSVEGRSDAHAIVAAVKAIELNDQDTINHTIEHGLHRVS